MPSTGRLQPPGLLSPAALPPLPAPGAVEPAYLGYDPPLVQQQSVRAIDTGTAGITVTFFQTATKGNLLVACYASRLPAGYVGVGTPAGWTLGLEASANSGTQSPDIALFYKISDGTETSVTFADGAPTAPGNGVYFAHFAEYAGIIQTAPVNIATATDSGAVPVLTLSIGPTAVTAQAEELAVALFVFRDIEGTAVWPAGYNQLCAEQLTSAAVTAPISAFVAIKKLTTAAAQTVPITVVAEGRNTAGAGLAVAILATFKINPSPVPKLVRPSGAVGHRQQRALLRRGAVSKPVPAQLNPPMILTAWRAPSRLRRTRGGKAATPPFAQATVAPTFVPQPAITPRRLAALGRKGRASTPIPAQVNPPIVQQTPRTPRRLAALGRRGRASTPIPAQVNPPIVQQTPRTPRRLATLGRRGRVATPNLPQLNPPIVTQVARAPRRFGRARSGATVTPPLAQATVAATFVPKVAARVLRQAIAVRRRTTPTAPVDQTAPLRVLVARRTVLRRRATVTVTPVPPQLNPPIVVQVARTPRRLGALGRKGRAVTPVQPQLNPPIIAQAATTPRRLGALGRRGRASTPIPPQLNPPIVVQVARTPRRLGALTRRPTRATPIPTQDTPLAARTGRRITVPRRPRAQPAPVPTQPGVIAPTWVPSPVARFARNRPTRPSRAVTPIPPQLNPPIVVPAARAPRRLAALGRRGRVATPIPPQLNPPIVTQPARATRRLAALGRKGRAATPVPAQAAPPIITPPARTPRRLAALGRRGRAVTPVPAQDTVPTTARRRNTITARLRRYAANPFGGKPAPPIPVTRVTSRPTLGITTNRAETVETVARVDTTGTTNRPTPTGTTNRPNPTNTTERP